jgi:hypothetical protein
MRRTGRLALGTLAALATCAASAPLSGAAQGAAQPQPPAGLSPASAAILSSEPELAEGFWPQEALEAYGEWSSWDGYIVTGREGVSPEPRYTAVSGTYVQPAPDPGTERLAALSPEQEREVATWIGLDGAEDSTVEQMGTVITYSAVPPLSMRCSPACPHHDSHATKAAPVGMAWISVWYEAYPEGPVTISLVVRPGDVLHLSVAHMRGDRFSLSFADETRGEHWHKVIAVPGARLGSAEWVSAEVKAGTYRPVAFPATGPVAWSQLSLTSSDPDPAASALIDESLSWHNLTGQSGVVNNSPISSSPIPSAGEGFTTTWAAKGTPPAPVSGEIPAPRLTRGRRGAALVYEPPEFAWEGAWAGWDSEIQWQRLVHGAWTAIRGQEGKALHVRRAWLGSTFRVQVTAQGEGGTTSLCSPAVLVPAPRHTDSSRR